MINCAIAGFGWWGNHLAGRLAHSKSMRVGVIVEPSAERAAAARAAGFRTVDQLDVALADSGIDAAILTTPNKLHEAQVIAAAAAGHESQRRTLRRGVP
jgi:predicted dehydrogenase